ncbi:tRNA(Met) cytidine acetyltransferase TmcA [Providencia rettgeri]|uniref:tRNA(Met) cytidine acetyltransferase TmcA n=1 Tax=Providencia rettgeri TaxID=587 RepID=UPI0018C6BBD1|nr:GNAT family N-acetyltransferase [Providencia rettgeri]MBG5900156.1 tRNA(Met) cytidine acetyltransferase [Providencia rettgeri]
MVKLLTVIIEQLHIVGMRRLMVLSGDDAWVEQQLKQLQVAIDGDWLTISSNLPQGVSPENAHLLLGREFLHGIFDVRKGFHSEALAMLAGTLKAGSLLVLCTAPQKEWATNTDLDSLRWNEQLGLISTPNFVHHLQRTFQTSPDILFYKQGNEPDFSLLKNKPLWQAPTGQPTEQQQQIISRLLSAEHGVWGLIAPRGRGKSAIAGMLIQYFAGECWCCAPAKVATKVLSRHAGKKINFWSPDSLLAYCRSNENITADWLIIDEASAIPNYILRELVGYFPRVLLTTTVDGYEGTGRGFTLKFCASLAHFTLLQLDNPMRYAANDPLELWVNEALLLQEPVTQTVFAGNIEYKALTQASLAENNEQLKAFYGLLMSAHYRTSPLDLRRLLDAQQQHFMVAKTESHNCAYIGALWMVDEGQLTESLSWQIWAGLRRPRGNLVVQSLAAHSYFPIAAQWLSRRVMRIAVDANHRRRQIGLTLLEKQKAIATEQGLDFLSVSFGLTPDLVAFWQKAGFRLMRIGSHKEASSGCFTAMAILSLSDRARRLCQQGEMQLKRDIYWRNDLSEFALETSEQQQLTPDDWIELIGFSEFKRPISASQSAIMRLLREETAGLALLRRHLLSGEPIAQICADIGMTGQKQWLQRVREEVGIQVKQYQPALLAEIKQKVISSCL